MVVCPICKAEVSDDANFCRNCRAKLRYECNCWIKKAPYCCGQSECPGYRLPLIEKQSQP